jgi:phospholipase C
VSLKELVLSVYLVIRHNGFQMVPIPQQSAILAEDSFWDIDQKIVDFGVGAALRKLYEVVLIGPYLRYVMTWFTGDERIRAIGAVDDVAELLTLEEPPPPRRITDLLLFSPAAHIAGYFSADGEVDVFFPKQANVWTRSWTHVVAGRFSPHATNDVAVCDAATGTLEFHASDGRGGFTLLKRHDRLRPNWTLMIAGNFGGSFTGLIFYDRALGVGEFYSTNGQGGITLLKRHTDWRRSWAQIVPGNFGGNPFTDLLFYDPAASTGEFYTTDGQGGITLLRQHTSFRNSWTLIVSGNIAGSIASFGDFPSLLFYDAAAGIGEFWATDGLGGMRLLKQHTGWRRSWEKIVLGGFGGSTRMGLLFYERGTGVVEIYNVDNGGNIFGLRQFTGWRTDWTHTVSGEFGGADILPARMTIPAADVRTLTDNIDHIVVLMLENRSFDHLLGYLTLDGGRNDVHGLTGRESNPLEPRQGTARKRVFPLSLTSPAIQTRDGFPRKVTRFLYDPAHGHMPQRYQRGGYQIAALPPGFHLPQPGGSDDPPPPPPPNFPIAPMEGFIIEHRERLDRKYPDLTLDEIEILKGEITGYYTATFVPVYDHLARTALICDHWHAAIPGETWPNRFVTLTGVLTRDAYGRFTPDNPDSTAEFDPIETPTIFDHLTAAGRTWHYYEHDFAMLRLFSKYTFDQTNIQPIDQFFKDAAAGTLPDVSFIDPDLIDISDDIHQANDDHPPSDIEHGQELVGRIFNALRTGPKWGRTLFVLTYDEHGGFYDHVFPDDEPALAPLFAWPEIHVVGGFLPPTRPAGFDVPVRFRGMRVPTFIISPHVAPGKATHTLFDHSTIAKTIIARFLPDNPPNMGPRVAQAPTLASVLTPHAALNVPQVSQAVLKSTHATPFGGLGAPEVANRSEDFHFMLKKLRARVFQGRE